MLNWDQKVFCKTCGREISRKETVQQDQAGHYECKECRFIPRVVRPHLKVTVEEVHCKQCKQMMFYDTENQTYFCRTESCKFRGRRFSLTIYGQLTLVKIR